MDGYLYLEQCIKFKSDNYKGFYFLLFDCSFIKIDVNYFNNRFINNRSEDICDDKGFICFGNFWLEEVLWIKVVKGKEKFKDIVKNFNNKDSKLKFESVLLKLLKDNIVYLN